MRGMYVNRDESRLEWTAWVDVPGLGVRGFKFECRLGDEVYAALLLKLVRKAVKVEVREEAERVLDTKGRHVERQLELARSQIAELEDKLAKLEIEAEAPLSEKEYGSGRVFLRGKKWWVNYWVDGKEVRESSGSSEKAEAEKLLVSRLAEAKGLKSTEGHDKLVEENERLQRELAAALQREADAAAQEEQREDEEPQQVESQPSSPAGEYGPSLTEVVVRAFAGKDDLAMNAATVAALCGEPKYKVSMAMNAAEKQGRLRRVEWGIYALPSFKGKVPVKAETKKAEPETGKRPTSGLDTVPRPPAGRPARKVLPEPEPLPAQSMPTSRVFRPAKVEAERLADAYRRGGSECSVRLDASGYWVIQKQEHVNA